MVRFEVVLLGTQASVLFIEILQSLRGIGVEGSVPSQALVHDSTDAPKVSLTVIVPHHEDFRSLWKMD